MFRVVGWMSCLSRCAPTALAAELTASRPLAAARAGFHAADYLTVLIYLAALVVMGAYFSRREKTTDDFFLAGRRIPWWAAGLSVFGTQLSAITFMAIPAKAYASDWVFLLVNLCIVLVAPIVVFVYLPFYRRLGVTTVYEYLERRFNVVVRIFGAGAFVLYQLGRMGIVLYLPALALSAATDLNLYTSILLMGTLATVYTVLGGIEAVIWTDVLQVFVLMGGALLALGVLVTEAGGFGHVLAVAQAHSKFHMINWTADHTTAALWVVLVGNVFQHLIPYTSDQAVVQRYLTTPDDKQAARAIWTNAALTIPASFLFFGLGTALFVYYQQFPDRLKPGLADDAVFPWFIARQLPVGVSGLVIAAVFAAAMSSLDSGMNSVATVVTTDFVRRFNPSRADRYYLALARLVTIVLGVVGTGTALIMAWADVESMWDMFLKVVGLFGSSMAGMLALGILTRRGTGLGALVGGVTSAAAVFAVQRWTDVHFFLYSAIGIGTCVIVGYVASVLLPSAPQSLAGLTIHTRRSEPGR